MARKRIAQRTATGALVLVLAYSAVVAYLRANETVLVFPGSTRTDAFVIPPSEAGFSWETVRVPAPAGGSTFLLVGRGDPRNGRWAIFFHGNGMFVSDGTGRYELLSAAGFNVLAVEYRGYGASRLEGPPTEAAVYLDAVAGWEYLTGDLGVAPTDIVVYGMSLGSGLATYLATQRKVAGLITEGAFTSAPDVAASAYPWLPARLVMRNRFDNLGRAARISQPWLILHGRRDRQIPYSHAERLGAAASGGRVVLLDAGHNDGVMADREVALEALRGFAEEVFESRAGAAQQERGWVGARSPIHLRELA